jgi:hypothetical protein
MFTFIKSDDRESNEIPFSETDARSNIRTLIVSMWVCFDEGSFAEKAEALFKEELDKFNELHLSKPITEHSGELIKTFLKSKN